VRRGDTGTQTRKGVLAVDVHQRSSLGDLDREGDRAAARRPRHLRIGDRSIYYRELGQRVSQVFGAQGLRHGDGVAQRTARRSRRQRRRLPVGSALRAAAPERKHERLHLHHRRRRGIGGRPAVGEFLGDRGRDRAHAGRHAVHAHPLGRRRRPLHNRRRARPSALPVRSAAKDIARITDTVARQIIPKNA
jgi:hypothetical protein